MAIKNRRYYWLQLKKDFFYSKEMKLLRRIPGGDTYTVIYLKMMLASLEEEGKIYIDGILENPYEEIALEIDEDKDAVEITINFLLSKNLITISQTEAVMEQVPEMIGSETASTRRSRKHREQKALQCNTDATNRNGDIEIDIEKELKKELKKDKELQQELDIDEPSEVDEEKFIDKVANNLGRGLVPFEYDILNDYLINRKVSEELFLEAVKIAVANNVRKFNYIARILDNWLDEGITTVAQAYQAQQDFKARKASKKKTSQIDEDEARRMQEKYGF